MSSKLVKKQLSALSSGTAVASSSGLAGEGNAVGAAPRVSSKPKVDKRKLKKREKLALAAAKQQAIKKKAAKATTKYFRATTQADTATLELMQQMLPTALAKKGKKH